ncbi:hypothetical protein XENORESO_015213 [Xenotaenia resolanae]|uniref:Uncharacterized protein n=1 Tax=Xenotaenia resolanae TaxID=208358 RepID=A0ABV0X495_9TELE
MLVVKDIGEKGNFNKHLIFLSECVCVCLCVNGVYCMCSCLEAQKPQSTWGAKETILCVCVLLHGLGKCVLKEEPSCKHLCKSEQNGSRLFSLHKPGECFKESSYWGKKQRPLEKPLKITLTRFFHFIIIGEKARVGIKFMSYDNIKLSFTVFTQNSVKNYLTDLTEQQQSLYYRKN